MKADKAKIVGGVRKKAPNSFNNKRESVFTILSRLLNDKEYQMSKDLPDLGLVEFLSDTENHKKLVNCNARMSSRLRLLVIEGTLQAFTDEEKNQFSAPIFSADNEEEKSNRYQKRFRPVLSKALKDHTLNTLTDVGICRLKIQNVSYIVRNAEVVQIDNGKYFLVWGDMTMCSNENRKQESVSNALEDNDIPDLSDVPDLSHNKDEDRDEDKDEDRDDMDNIIPDNALFTKNDVEI